MNDDVGGRRALKVDTKDLCYDIPPKVRMSAEVESNPDDQVNGVKRPWIFIKETHRNWIKLGLIVGKILELFICMVCMGLIYEPAQTAALGKTHLHHIGIMYTAFGGYKVINGVAIVSILLGEKIPYRMASLYAVMGCALFLVTGILLTIDRPYLNNQYYFHPQQHLLIMYTISILFVFLNVILFAADAVFSFIMHIS
ncbi:hypothetical protein NQ317_009191 [Molorchus minor]|uniref:Uncharacterized protein n=1 Tax=Molorchus minor TaxID=1323400 RepID=A0ABQ9JR15_9CUCU|nr:hypothetical protein NQ317_009191 [Molorchus minor]